MFILTRKHVFFATVVVLLVLLFFAPQLTFMMTAPINTEADTEHIGFAEVAIVFGAGVKSNGDPSPLLQERLDAAVYLYEADTIEEIVVSNTYEEALAMQQYLIKNNVPESVIEIDGTAYTTLDTCKAERENHPGSRTRLFLSQGYHIPRVIEQCRREGVNGRALAVEEVTPVIDSTNFCTKYCVRGYRFLRESVLSWLVAVDIYR